MCWIFLLWKHDAISQLHHSSLRTLFAWRRSNHVKNYWKCCLHVLIYICIPQCVCLCKNVHYNFQMFSFQIWDGGKDKYMYELHLLIATFIMYHSITWFCRTGYDPLAQMEQTRKIVSHWRSWNTLVNLACCKIRACYLEHLGYKL